MNTGIGVAANGLGQDMNNAAGQAGQAPKKSWTEMTYTVVPAPAGLITAAQRVYTRVERVQQNELGSWLVTLVQSWDESYEGQVTLQHDDLPELEQRLTDIFNAVPDAALEEFSIMNIYKSDLFKFITGDMVKDNPVVMTIASVQMEQLENGGRKESKPVIYFDKNKKGAVLNKTNAKSIAAEYGGETDDWKGKQVKLFAEAGTWFGVSGHALRMVPYAPVNGNGRSPVATVAEADSTTTPEDDLFDVE